MDGSIHKTQKQIYKKIKILPELGHLNKALFGRQKTCVASSPNFIPSGSQTLLDRPNFIYLVGHKPHQEIMHCTSAKSQANMIKVKRDSSLVYFWVDSGELLSNLDK